MEGHLALGVLHGALPLRGWEGPEALCEGGAEDAPAEWWVNVRHATSAEELAALVEVSRRVMGQRSCGMSSSRANGGERGRSCATLRNVIGREAHVRSVEGSDWLLLVLAVG